MLADVGFLCEDLDLDLDRADLHPTRESGDDRFLFPHAAEQEVDRLDLQDLDIPTVRHVNDAVTDISHRDQVFRVRLFAAVLLIAALCSRRWNCRFAFQLGHS